MLIVVIATSSYAEAQTQIQLALSLADGIELRLDYFLDLNIIEIAALRTLCTLPVIFTLRAKTQGGLYCHSESERFNAMLQLCVLAPDYIDLEYHVSEHSAQCIAKQYPQIKLIRSYHDFQKTPSNLEALLESMQSPIFQAYKIVTHAQTTLDALFMLHFVKQKSKNYCLSGFCMGEEGMSTRVLAPIVGAWMTYCFLENTQAVVTGQLSIQSLLNIYHYRNLNSQTKVFALVGDPVHLSVGHILHNQALSYLKKNAVYIKLRLSAEALESGWHFFQDSMWGGMSVTMPLKEKILPLLETLKTDITEIQAVNTVSRHANHWLGDNTDGRGAWQAISQYLGNKSQTLLILGAGGAARAIAYEARHQGIKSLILNRTLAKAQNLATEIGGEAYELKDLKDLKSRYTLIINTLPFSSNISFSTLILNEHAVAMDIVYQPIQTEFLQRAKEVGCRCVFGYEMYIHQALLQIQSWFQLQSSALKPLKSMMYQYFKEQF